MSFGLIVESAEKRGGGEAAGCARGHIVGEGIRPNWAHLAHFLFKKICYFNMLICRNRAMLAQRLYKMKLFLFIIFSVLRCVVSAPRFGHMQLGHI